MEYRSAASEKNLDRRQKKTRQAIQTALMSLIKDKPLEKITVSELAATADVNRKTFYNHYSSIQDVRRELDEQYVDMLFSFMDRTDLEVLANDPAPFITQIISAMVKQPVRARLVFESGEHLYLADRMKTLIQPYIAQLAESHQLPTNIVHYTLEYVVSGALSVLNSWVHAEYALSPQELGNIITALVRSSVYIVEHPDETL